MNYATPISLQRGFRALHSSVDTVVNRSLRSRLWQPTGGISQVVNEGGHEKLLRAGYVRQSNLGTFNLLPLGLRVQEKLEHLADAAMRQIGASKISLSSITSEELWGKSGRLNQTSSELFRFEDRRRTPLLLSPTHEEEITHLVSKTVNSHKDLPLMLYQISRKYRDELRPRHGLLRSREFTMKDLYTFDIDIPSALQTYRRVGESYSHFFNQLSLPFIVAEASCGDMGGSMSHEYHIPSRLGEDTVVSCQQCGYAANEEVAALEGSVGIQPNISGPPRNPRVAVWRGVTKRRDTLVNVWYNSDRNAHSPINIHAVKALVPDLDPTIEDAAPIWDELLGKTNRIKSSTQPLNLVNLLDFRVAHLENEITNKPASLPAMFPPGSFVTEGVSQIFISKSALGRPLNLARVQNGDACPRCETGTVTVTRTLELGHTFHLGTRYSDPLAARVTIPQNKSGSHVPTSLAIQMGCFGIGITRIMGAIAEELSDEKGLIWPLRIAPYQVIIVPDFDLVQEAGDVYDTITTMSLGSSMSSLRHVDAIIDDRPQSMPWKLKDADITGYPILIIMGRSWRESGRFEVQCRQLSLRELVYPASLPHHIHSLMQRMR